MINMVQTRSQLDLTDIDIRQLVNRHKLNEEIISDYRDKKYSKKFEERRAFIASCPKTESGIPMQNINRIMGVTFYDAALRYYGWDLGDMFVPRCIQGCCSCQIERGDCCQTICTIFLIPLILIWCMALSA